MGQRGKIGIYLFLEELGGILALPAALGTLQSGIFVLHLSRSLK